jgi:transposase
MSQLKKEEVVTLKTLKAKGQSNAEIARTLGVTEGAVRYRLRRDGVADGRRKVRLAAKYAELIEHWLQEHEAREAPRRSPRPANLRELFEWLVDPHEYSGSYNSVRRYVRATYPPPRLRPYRRVETPPGAQAQVDWGEFAVDLGDGPQKLYAFVMVLAHSRRTAVVWCRRMDQLAWHHGHNEAFRRLGGIPAVVRIDNLKTGVAVGAGPWGELNTSYRTYARSVRFHIDPCLPRSPEHKGKVERRVEVLRGLEIDGRQFDGLADLQRRTDEQLERLARRRKCPATGETIEASWQAELPRLQPLPLLPEVFDVSVSRPVQPDCTVHFESRQYSVPFVLTGRTVEVRGCTETVQILHDGRVVAEHRRGTKERLLLDPRHYEGAGDDRVRPPQPLGAMARKLAEIALAPVEQRPLDLYAALTEVAR